MSEIENQSTIHPQPYDFELDLDQELLWAQVIQKEIEALMELDALASQLPMTRRYSLTQEIERRRRFIWELL